MALFSANTPARRRRAASGGAAADSLPLGTRNAKILTSLAYAALGVASGVALGLTLAVAEPLATRVFISAPAGLLSRARDLARQVEPFIDQTSEYLAEYLADFLGWPADSHHMQMEERALFEFDRRVQHEQRAARLDAALEASTSSYVAPRRPRRRSEPTLFATMARSAFSSGPLRAAEAFEAEAEATDAAAAESPSSRSWRIRALPAKEETDSTPTADPFELPAAASEALESAIAKEEERAAAAAAAAAAEAAAAAAEAAAAAAAAEAKAAANAKAAAEREARNKINKELASQAFSERALPVCVARFKLGLPPLPEKKVEQAVAAEVQQQQQQQEQQPRPRTVSVRTVDGGVIETPEIEVFTIEDWNDEVEKEEQEGGLFGFDDDEEEEEEEGEEMEIDLASSSSSSTSSPPSAPVSVFHPSRMPAAAEVLSTVVVGKPEQRKNALFFANVVRETISKINGEETRSVLSPRSSDSSLSSRALSSDEEEVGASPVCSNDAATTATTSSSSRPPLPPAHSQALASLEASIANGELDPEHENHSLEAFAAGRDKLCRLRRERVQRQLLEESNAEVLDFQQQEEKGWLLEQRGQIEAALSLFEQDRREREARAWADDFERRGRAIFEETVTKLQLDNQQKRADARKYWFDENPFDVNLIDVLLEGQGSACAAFFRCIDEDEDARAAALRNNGNATTSTTSSSSGLLVLEEQRGDFYRNLPDVEKYILSKKEQAAN